MRPYTKLNSQGNDFILTESDTTMPDISVANIIKYSSRDNIGCDQFFIIDTTDKKNISDGCVTPRTRIRQGYHFVSTVKSTSHWLLCRNCINITNMWHFLKVNDSKR